MRKTILVASLGLVTLLGAFVVLAETPETWVIDDCMNKKSGVEFPHAAHFELTECTTCHHTQEGLTADSGEAVQPCSDCHNEPEAADTPKCSEMSLKKNHYHINCVGCHKEQGAGPAKCNECHPKAEG